MACVKISSFLRLNNIHLYAQATLYVSIHLMGIRVSSTLGYCEWHCYECLYRTLVCTLLHLSWMSIQVEVLGHITTPWLNFQNVAAPFHIPTSNVWGFQVFHILINSRLVCLFYFCHPSGCKLVPYCGFDCISLMTNDLASFYVLMAISFGEIPL